MPKYSEEKKQLVEEMFKDKIFCVACELLQRDRRELFTMIELADKAGVSKGTLYNYFKDKYEVIFFIEQRLIVSGEKNIGEILAADSDCRTILCVLLKHLYLGYKRYRFIFAATAIARAEKKKRGMQVMPNESPRNIVLEFLRKGVAKGELAQEAPEVLDQYMMVILGGLNLYPYADLKNTSLPDNLSDALVDKIIAYAVDGICLKGK
ncbi:MAG: TetR/AcrR family transcriptional regulator [Phascolarctobacterium sp.]|uniref:TetR/AcrR family transcriptional regulator n=1 Tax=Phascolarctobacterium sp. TaxID=2049039 RepID=UPI0026DD7FDB|nr:TetR/AcrR family transcriptional regulator [Phascolarctobacterium sp.]MDO4920967.1 TetR/AcrR family transcriptional regulator [Phascolarctobacterium sp.]